MWWAPEHGFGWWMIFGWMWMAVIWGLIILGIVWVVRMVTRPGDKTGTDDPVEIARRRYASGEITREELEEITGTLSNK